MQWEPTWANTLEALPLVGGRIDVALTEIARLIETYLPQNITGANASGIFPRAIPQPIFPVRQAPDTIQNLNIDQIFIEGSTVMEPHGTGAFREIGLILIHSVDERIHDESNQRLITTRAKLIQAILLSCLTAHPNPEGLIVWRELAPKGISGLPAEWSKYAGATLTYRCTQAGDDVFPST